MTRIWLRRLKRTEDRSADRRSYARYRSAERSDCRRTKERRASDGYFRGLLDPRGQIRSRSRRLFRYAAEYPGSGVDATQLIQPAFAEHQTWQVPTLAWQRGGEFLDQFVSGSIRLWRRYVPAYWRDVTWTSFQGSK